MLRAIIAGIVTAAVAFAIAVTLREDVGLRWFGPDFIAPGARLPEARMGEKPPAAPVVHISREWITVRAKRVASAEEAFSCEDLIIEGLYGELVSIGETLGKWEGPRVIPVDAEGRIIPEYGPEDDLVIQADRDVEFELLRRVFYTCGRAEYGRLNLAAINPESWELEVFSLELPYTGIPGTAPVAAEPESEPGLVMGDDSLTLSYRDASGEHVFSTIEKDYSILSEELKRMKRRRPGQKSLLIICAAHVEYEELIGVLEVLVQPEIALKEIYIGRDVIEEKRLAK
jgi:biopolymer transport protein ExbD